MNAGNDTHITKAVFLLASVSGIWLLFNLVAMPLAWGGVDAGSGASGVVQLVILLGFLVVILFDLISLLWAVLRGGDRLGTGQIGGLVALGLLSLVAMAAAKVMVDEIARETPMGAAGGEWGILYAVLILQLSYVLVVLFRTKPENR